MNTIHVMPKNGSYRSKKRRLPSPEYMNGMNEYTSRWITRNRQAP